MGLRIGLFGPLGRPILRPGWAHMGQPMGHLNVSQAGEAHMGLPGLLKRGLRIGLFGAYSEAHPGPVQAGFSLRVKGFLHISLPRRAPGGAQIGLRIGLF